jgi:threonylcarbamoyladenosine tRNA methylthiotransferase MtaB
MDRAYLKTLLDSGLGGMTVGIESGSQKVIDLIQKKVKVNEVEQNFKDLGELGSINTGTSWFVGFPGETDEDFKETIDFLKDLDISYLHVFTYSERAMTKALDIKPVVPIQVRNERNKILRNLSYQKQQFFNAQHIGETRSVLFESIKQKDPNDIPMLEGYTDNYIKIITPYRAEWSNQIVDWKIN